jgi:translation elongation factor EF-Ts
MIVITGKAMWAKVFEPDTHFDPDGVYTVDVMVPETEAAELCEQLDEVVNTHHTKVVKEQPKLKAVLSTAKPYQPEVDDDGNPTGNLRFRAKMKAVVKSRDGKTFNMNPIVVDSKRNPLTKDTLIGNGSVIKVAVEPAPYMMQSTKSVGVSLRLKAVQVIDLVQYSAGANIFDEEDGFVSSAVAKDDATDVFDEHNNTGTANDEGDF